MIGGNLMPQIRPVSDLRNHFSDISRTVHETSEPVILTKNGYDKMTRHDHLVCRRCGKLTDICFQDLTKLLQSQTNEELLSYDLQVSYICPACRRTVHPASTTDP